MSRFWLIVTLWVRPSLILGLDWCSRSMEECIEDDEVRTCKTSLHVEWYHSLSKACYSCPHLPSDCFRHHCIPADGHARPLLVANRSLPGPSIQVCHGDTVIVDVVNMLPAMTTSLHWHGQHMRGTPFMDGVPMVTQCPIQPGTSFRYTFRADQAGTHFWHSHSGWQRGDGLLGPLIVREKQRSSDFDHDHHTMVIMDWDSVPSSSTFTGHHHAHGSNKPHGLLINGRGLSPNSPPALFNVAKGQRYRFRLINAGVLNCPVQISVDNHTMKVINSDGNYIQPITVDSLVSYAGERWDFVVTADQEEGSYWVRVRGLMDCDERFTEAHQAAVLRYTGVPETQLPQASLGYRLADRKGLTVNSLNSGVEDKGLIISELVSAGGGVDDPALAPVPDSKITISFDFNPVDNPRFHLASFYGFLQVFSDKERVYTPQLNHVSMKLGSSPLLTDGPRPGSECPLELDLEGGPCTTAYCECTHIVPLKLGSVVELILIDIGMTYDANHPFHIHGHSFRVVAMDRLGRNITRREVLAADQEGRISRNLKNPPIKDTVTVPDGGYTVLRFLADNPGYWLFHCHLEFHSELGMSLVFKVGEEEDFPSVPEGFPRCGNYLPESVLPTDVSTHIVELSTSAVTTPQLEDSSLKEEELTTFQYHLTAPPSFTEVQQFNNLDDSQVWSYNTSDHNGSYPSLVHWVEPHSPHSDTSHSIFPSVSFLSFLLVLVLGS